MERCYPIIPTVCPMAGATSPYSVAGTILQSNVETLLPVLTAQVYKPGQAVYYCAAPSVTDMRSGHDLYYNDLPPIVVPLILQVPQAVSLGVTPRTGWPPEAS